MHQWRVISCERVNTGYNLYFSECTDSFTSKSKTGSDGGDGQSDVETLDDCKDACRDDEECLGFDWTLDDNADTRCWLHTDADKFEDSGDNDDSDQYTRQKCEGMYRKSTKGYHCMVRENIYLSFSSNSEANASDLLENLKRNDFSLLHVYISVLSGLTQSSMNSSAIESF